MQGSFIAIDVETANEKRWSICQVGYAIFENGEIVDTWKSLINPQTYFDQFNVEIHGITPDMVKGSMKHPEMLDFLSGRVNNQVLVHHTAFDRASFSLCANERKRPQFNCRWLDSSRVARRTWEEVVRRGYGLPEMAERLEIPLEHHHDALEDAIVAGKILLKAIEKTGIPFDQWLVKAYETISMNEKLLTELAAQEPDLDGPLYGEVVVFTGALSITRLEAARLAYKMGCNIDEGVTKNTTLLVVGDQDLQKLAGYTKSSKHRKAEELRAKGQNIRIIGENDFNEMVDY